MALVSMKDSGTTIKESQINKATSRLAVSIAGLEKVTEELEARLERILRSEPMAPSPDKDGPSTVALATEINASSERISGVTDHIRDILEQMEL